MRKHKSLKQIFESHKEGGKKGNVRVTLRVLKPSELYCKLIVFVFSAYYDNIWAALQSTSAFSF